MTSQYQTSISALLDASLRAEEEELRAAAERTREARQALEGVLVDLFSPDWFAMLGLDPANTEYDGDQLVCRGQARVEEFESNVSVHVWEQKGVTKAIIRFADGYQLPLRPQQPPDLEKKIGSLLLLMVRESRARQQRAEDARRNKLMGKIRAGVHRGTSDEQIRQIKAEIDSFPVELRGELRRRLAQEIRDYVLVGRRQRRRNEAEIREQKVRLAALRSLALEFAEIYADWQEKAREWANEWTQVFWEPRRLWLLRYAPVGFPPGRDGEDSEYIVRIATITDPHTLRDVCADVVQVDRNGELRRVVIGSLLDSVEVEPVAASIERALEYHQHYRAGRYVVNVPAYIHRGPPPFAAAEPQWVAFVRGRDAELEELAERYDWQSLGGGRDDQA